jgi:broad-specificity NMP kinase
MARKNPNIIVTGTPGVGKTTHAEQLARATGLKHVSVNQIVKDEGFHEGKDEETGSWIVDEDKVCARCEMWTGDEGVRAESAVWVWRAAFVRAALHARCSLLAALAS